MNSFLRDMAILAALIVVGVLTTIWSVARRVGRRIEGKDGPEGTEQASPQAAPIPGLADYAASLGWQGPSTDLGTDHVTGNYVQEMLRNLWSEPRRADENVRVAGPWFANLYSGQTGGRSFLIGNAWIDIGGTNRPGSVCVLHLGEMLPPLFVNLRACQPYLRFGMKEMAFESEDFNRRFQVLALNREYAMDVVTERSMEILMERDDWVFFLELDRLVCLAKSALASVHDYSARLDAVTGFAALIPSFVQQDRAAHMPALPDGTVIDPFDPASRERFKQALLAMSPEDREQFLGQVRVEGARFLAGMFGKELPPEVIERIESHTRSDPSTSSSPPEGSP